MGDVISFPSRQHVAESASEFLLISFRDREIAAAAAYLRNAADLIEKAGRRGYAAEASFAAAVSDAKTGLFHAITLAGCRNADSHLRAALAETKRNPTDESQ